MTILFGFLFLSALSAIYVSMESNIYYWDFATGFSEANHLNNLYHSHPIKAVGKIFSSIWKSDYNYFSAIIPSIFIYLIKNQREIYIQTILLIYCVPFSALFVYIFSKVMGTHKLLDILFPLFLVMTNMVVVGTILRGFPDVGGLIFIEYAIILAISVDYSKNICIKKAILLGVSLWMAFLFRRWYAYTIVTLYISLPVFNYFYFNMRGNYGKIVNSVKNFCIAGVSSVVMLLVFQFGLLLKILKTDYSIAYTAYKKPLNYSIDSVLNGFGYYVLPIFIFGIIFMLMEKNKKIQLYISFCFFNLILSMVLFFRTQSPDIHHILPFSFWMMMIAAYGAFCIFNRVRGGGVLRAISCVYMPVALIIALFCDRPYHVPLLRLVLPMQFPPLHIDNFQTYQQLVDDLKRDYAPYGSIAILSSGFVLNTSMVENISNYHLVTENIAHVDLRDHFNPVLLNAKYVVIVSPVQTDLPAVYQRVITVPAYEILNTRGVGKSYKRVGHSYELRPNVYAYIYEKFESFSAEQISYFNQELYAYYPDWEKKHYGYKE
ncbi:hypothetical protein GOB86_07450 [Acetobacter lambici]|uniref:hypothetical protein n=1 Tax=Acetobacter lambici TaxID=1332824 RepID=UPI00140727AD|nr:hypothetical protein [Acetobacter lambici]NHO56899.1 hypothetical protein [Acetobacter lambici]